MCPPTGGPPPKGNTTITVFQIVYMDSAYRPGDTEFPTNTMFVMEQPAVTIGLRDTVDSRTMKKVPHVPDSVALKFHFDVKHVGFLEQGVRAQVKRDNGKWDYYKLAKKKNSGKSYWEIQTGSDYRVCFNCHISNKPNPKHKAIDQVFTYLLPGLNPPPKK